MGKRRFMGIVRSFNSRYELSSEASRLSNDRIEVKCNGWDSGIEVTTAGKETKDFFDITVTGGSNHTIKDVYLGQIYVEAGQIYFSPGFGKNSYKPVRVN